MKKIAIVACLIASGSYAMNCPEELDVASSSNAVYDIKNVDKTVKIDITDPDLIGQWQNVTEVLSSEESDDNIFETPASTYKEGRFWTVVRKVFQPLQITTSASTMVLITASEVVKGTHPSVATGFSYGALGTAVTSGVLSLFITKMNSRISQLNKKYKAKLAAENRDIDIEEI